MHLPREMRGIGETRVVLSMTPRWQESKWILDRFWTAESDRFGGWAPSHSFEA